MKVRTVTFACGMGLIAAGAVCNPAAAGHWYLAGQAGAVFLKDPTFSVSFPSGSTSCCSAGNFDTGWPVGGSAGYGFSNGLRVEGEVTYLQNTLKGATFNGVFFPASGDESSWAFMANGYCDISTGSRWTH